MNSESVEVGKWGRECRRIQRTDEVVCGIVQRARKSSSACSIVHHAHCVGVAFYRKIFSTKCSQRAIRENLDPRNISAIRYVPISEMYLISSNIP